MYSKQILANSFTTKRFVTQIVIIILLGGIVPASMAMLGWDLRLLFAFSPLVGIALLSTILNIHSRFTQFWVLATSNILVGLIPIIFLRSYCYFQIENHVCSARSVTAYSLAFWVFPSIMLWIPWIFALLGKSRKRYG